MPDDRRSWAAEPFEELRGNLNYARELVSGGRYLERLQVGAFDVADLYRAAWVQAVSALDHWVFRELNERALGLVLNASEHRPVRFLKLPVPMSLFEEVHHRSGNLEKAFAEHFYGQFRYQSFQSPERIKEAFSQVSETPLWPNVAKQLAAKGCDDLSTRDAVVECLRGIARRRNKIAHEADRDPEDGMARLAVSSDDADRTIDRIEMIAEAIVAVLGPPPATELVQPVVTTASPRQHLYLRFWAEFKPVVERRGWTKARPQAQNWWDMPAGVDGTIWVVSFSQFGCRSELNFQHRDPAINLARWQVLADRRDEIVARFGEGLIFDDLPHRKSCRIETRMFDVTIEDRDKWPAIRQWMEDSQVRLRAAVAAVGGVPRVT